MPDRLQGLPFAATRWNFFVGPASLFLAAIFGKATTPEVDQLFAQIAVNVTESTTMTAPGTVQTRSGRRFWWFMHCATKVFFNVTYRKIQSCNDAIFEHLT